MHIQLHESFAIHPGPLLLDEIIKPHSMTVSSTAELLKVAVQELSRLLNGEAAFTPDMAARIEIGFGVSAATILRMQAAYDLAQAKGSSDTL